VGLIKAILALFKAFPALERLFVQVSNAVREANASQRYEDKLAHIDNAMRIHGLPDDSKVRERQGTDSTPAVSESGDGSTGLHATSIENDSTP
tara:strand:- start:3029 stop:3307 length:279 start_codon:yes stop_codon:yes gene_type:complete